MDGAIDEGGDPARRVVEIPQISSSNPAFLAMFPETARLPPRRRCCTGRSERGAGVTDEMRKLVGVDANHIDVEDGFRALIQWKRMLLPTDGLVQESTVCGIPASCSVATSSRATSPTPFSART